MSTSGKKLTIIAKRRGVSPERLHRLVKGDLDWIVMKALEKDRNRRYESASDLAMDIHRFAGHEPVAARGPSATYRISKFVRRNRSLVLAIAAVGGFGCLAIAGTAFGLLRIRRTPCPD